MIYEGLHLKNQLSKTQNVILPFCFVCLIYLGPIILSLGGLCKKGKKKKKTWISKTIIIYFIKAIAFCLLQKQFKSLLKKNKNPEKGTKQKQTKSNTPNPTIQKEKHYRY